MDNSCHGVDGIGNSAEDRSMPLQRRKGPVIVLQVPQRNVEDPHVHSY